MYHFNDNKIYFACLKMTYLRKRFTNWFLYARISWTFDQLRTKKNTFSQDNAFKTSLVGCLLLVRKIKDSFEMIKFLSQLMFKKFHIIDFYWLLY